MKPDLRAFARRAAYALARRSGVPALRRRAGAAIFCFHNVVPDALTGNVGDRSLHVGTSDFRDYIDWITSAYTVVPIAELIDRLHRGLPVGRLAVLAFDDGYRGIVRHAIPIMRSARTPFAVFPVTDYASRPRPFWWDLCDPRPAPFREGRLVGLQGDAARILDATAPERTSVHDDLLPASWAELRASADGDCTFGAHTVTHRNVATLDDGDLEQELALPRRIIAEELDVTPEYLVYPYGRYDHQAADAARRGGYRAAMTLDTGLVKHDSHHFMLPRVVVAAGMSVDALACWGSDVDFTRRS
jgi:peptidoglycan/xylan/chitin deacetylase (PgdA/CDA1 family)